jgi:hypothetical protein
VTARGAGCRQPRANFSRLMARSEGADDPRHHPPQTRRG